MGTIVVATSEAVVAGSGEVLVETIHAGLATGDGSGGLLIDQGRQIWHLPADGSAPSRVVDANRLPGEDVRVALMNGGLVDGFPHAVYVVTEVRGESAFPDVVIHNLLTGEVRSYLTDQGYEGGLGHVSVAGGVLSASNSAEGCSWFDLVTLDGTALPFDNPFGGGCDRSEFPQIRGGVLSPDGLSMVYLSPDDYPNEDIPIDVVLFDLVAGREVARVALPMGDWYWGRMDYDGTRVLVTARESPSSGVAYGKAILVDEVDEAVTAIELPDAGPASFAK